jgi:hypothetical protein
MKKGPLRNEAMLVMRKEGLPHWKKVSVYHRHSLVVNRPGFSRHF